SRRGLCRCGRHDSAVDVRRHAHARPGLYAACICYRHHRRHGVDARCAARRDAGRFDRSSGRAAFHAVGQEHVLLRDPGAGTAFPAAGHHGQENGMIARLTVGIAPSTLALLGVLLAVLVSLPMIASDYVLTVLILILYFAYLGQAWNIMLGFVGQLSL